MVNNLPDLDILDGMFILDGNVLRYRVNFKEAGWVDKLGYRRVQINYKDYLVHRIIWKMWTGEEPPKCLDHVDRNPSNNDISNLRPATHQINMHNRNSKGYYFNKKVKKFQAYLRVNGKMKSLGYYNSEDEARKVYLQAKEKLMMELTIG